MATAFGETGIASWATSWQATAWAGTLASAPFLADSGDHCADPLESVRFDFRFSPGEPVPVTVLCMVLNKLILNPMKGKGRRFRFAPIPVNISRARLHATNLQNGAFMQLVKQAGFHIWYLLL